jgi:hypothetical protein
MEVKNDVSKLEEHELIKELAEFCALIDDDKNKRAKNIANYTSELTGFLRKINPQYREDLKNQWEKSLDISMDIELEMLVERKRILLHELQKRNHNGSAPFNKCTLKNDATAFLKRKGMIKSNYSTFSINREFGTVDLAELLAEFKMSR